MSKKRRTKKQKQRARQRRVQTRQVKKTKTSKVLKKETAAIEKSLFAYDPKLIVTDLTKTVVLSILAIAIIGAIYLLKII